MSTEPTAEQVAAANRALHLADNVRMLGGVDDPGKYRAEYVAGAIAAAVAAERAKYEAVRALHIRDQDGGTDRDHWVCQECDRAWPCETVKLIQAAA